MNRNKKAEMQQNMGRCKQAIFEFTFKYCLLKLFLIIVSLMSKKYM